MIGFLINMLAIWFNVLLYAFTESPSEQHTTIFIVCVCLNFFTGLFCLAMDAL